MFEQEVSTKDGNLRMVRARSLDALNEAVQAAQADSPAPAPDINNPDHANVIVSEFMAPEPVEKPKRGPGRPKKVAPIVESEAAREADDSMEEATVEAEAEAGIVE